MDVTGEIELEQEARAMAWAHAIWSLRDPGSSQARDVLDWVIHEATWFVPLPKKSVPARRFRYVSESIHSAQRVADFRQEHVTPRKKAEAEILGAASEDEVQAILAGLVVCAVTLEEHNRLDHGTLIGWDRYRDAGVRVWDGLENKWLW